MADEKRRSEKAKKGDGARLVLSPSGQPGDRRALVRALAGLLIGVRQKRKERKSCCGR